MDMLEVEITMGHNERMKKMTKKEGREYLKRWRGVNRFLMKEWRKTPLSKRLRDFFILLDAFSLKRLYQNQKQNVKQDKIVMERWAKLRHHFLHG